MRVIPRALPLLLAAIASYVVPPALLAQGPKSGNILVANQEDASASSSAWPPTAACSFPSGLARTRQPSPGTGRSAS